MNILSLYAHHEPSSLTASLKNVASSVLAGKGHQIKESDLYGGGFSPKAEKFDFNTLSGKHFNYMLEQRYAASQNMAFSPDIAAEFQKLKEADLLMIHTPIWWLGVPAILKGWFDRVLVMGAAWDSGKIYENGLLRGKVAFVCAVAGGPQDFYSEQGKHKATIEQILHPIHHGTLAYCGMDILEPFVVFNALGLDTTACGQVLKEYQLKIEHLIDSPVYLHKY